MAASSVAVLTQAFDFDLHLENEKTTSPLLSSRSMNFLYIAVTLALLSPLLYLHPLQFSIRQPQTSINNAITDQISERLEQTKDLNEQISSRMNILNDTISSLRSRVFEVEKKPLISNIDVFVAAKSKIDESLKSLKTRIEAQSKKWDETAKIQQRTAAELEKTRIARSLEISATNTVITNIEGKFTGLRSKIEAVTTSQISITQTRLTAHKQLLQEVAKLEERFQSALENAGDVFSYMKGDLEFAFNDTTSSWDRVASSSYSDAFVESIVRDVWTENEEAYQDTLPNRVCPRSPALVAAATTAAAATAAATTAAAAIKLDATIETEIKREAKIISPITPESSTSKNIRAEEKEKEKEKQKEKEKVKEVEKEKEKQKEVEKEKEKEKEKMKMKPIPVAVVIPPDFARRVAGAHIVLEGTSATYIHPERNLKHYSNRFLKYFGINEDSYICNNRIVDQLSQYADSITPFLTNALGLNNGIGSPEDIISPDMSLGSCWPMQVRELLYE